MKRWNRMVWKIVREILRLDLHVEVLGDLGGDVIVNGSRPRNGDSLTVHGDWIPGKTTRTWMGGPGKWSDPTMWKLGKDATIVEEGFTTADDEE